MQNLIKFYSVEPFEATGGLSQENAKDAANETESAKLTVNEDLEINSTQENIETTKEETSTFKQALQDWSNDDERDRQIDDSTPLNIL